MPPRARFVCRWHIIEHKDSPVHGGQKCLVEAAEWSTLDKQGELLGVTHPSLAKWNFGSFAECKMTNSILMQYLGFGSKGQWREYAFQVRYAGEDVRDFTLTIPNEAFTSHRVR